MKPYQANLYNAIVLLILGFTGYCANNFNLHTGIVPIGSGILLLLLYIPMKKNNILVSHLIVVITFILMIAFIWPLKRNIDQQDNMGIMRVTIEILSCALATLVYLKHFIENRKIKPAQ